MEMTFNVTSQVGLGYASQVDAFQRGREAAQMAKSQIADGAIDLALAFGPATLHFQDFIEGVRLVTGEEKLIGIPASRILSAEMPSPDASLVIAFSSPSSRFSIAAAEGADGLVSATSLMTQFRTQRGDHRQFFEHRGVLVFDNAGGARTALPTEMCGHAGLESLLIDVSLDLPKGVAMACRNRFIRRGAIGLECLSPRAWGAATVGIGAFLNQPDIYRQAVKSATRDAASQLNEKPALGLVWFDFPPDQIDPDHLWELFETGRQQAKNLALIGLPCEQQFTRALSRSITVPKNSVTAVMVPQ